MGSQLIVIFPTPYLVASDHTSLFQTWMGITVGSCDGFVLHGFCILARRLYESWSSDDNMKRRLKESEVKEVTGVTGPEGMPLVKYPPNSLLFSLQ